MQHLKAVSADWKHGSNIFTSTSALPSWKTHVPTDDPKVIAALKANNVLEAIKLYRMAISTGSVTVSLEEAKVAVEEIRSRLGI